MTLKKIKGKYALVSKSNPKKILQWFGKSKPSDKQIRETESRIQFWKSLNKP